MGESIVHTSLPDDPLLSALLDKFAQASACWYSSVRQSNRSHLAPIWHVWHTPAVYVATQATTVRTRNMQFNNSVSLALPDTNNVLIIEGVASIVNQVPEELYSLFQTKYNWDVRSDTSYKVFIKIVPSKVLAWGEHGNGRWICDPTTHQWSKVA